MFIRVYASGTNIQRLAKCSKKIDAVIYSAYSELERTEPDIIKRHFFCTHIDALKQEVEKLDQTVMPSWTKIWGRPLANESFISGLFSSLSGSNSLRPELNLSAICDEPVYCFMLLVSANKKEMSQIAKIAERTLPDWHIKVLNGDYTTNQDAEDETKTEINRARIDGKKGMIIIANQMGSRSYSVSEIQATVIAYDRGSVDATTQKVSRCLTPGALWDQNKKIKGAIVDLSFDPNRAENIERVLLEESIMVQRSELAADFSSAVKYVLSSIDLFKMNQYGHPIEVSEADMFKIYSDNDAMLRVADISVDIVDAMENGAYDILSQVNTGGKPKTDKKPVVGEGVKNSVKEGVKNKKHELTDKEKQQAEAVINAAIKAINMSATSVYHLANLEGESYRGCLEIISQDKELDIEFIDFYGISAEQALQLLNLKVLNEAILDVIVQNSKPDPELNLFI